MRLQEGRSARQERLLFSDVEPELDDVAVNGRPNKLGGRMVT